MSKSYKELEQEMRIEAKVNALEIAYKDGLKEADNISKIPDRELLEKIYIKLLHIEIKLSSL